jgi:hypothetical protein
VATTRASSSGPLMSYMVVTRLYRVIVKRDGSAALSAFQNRPSRSRRPAHPCGAAVTPLARPVQAALRRAAPCCTPLRRVPAHAGVSATCRGQEWPSTRSAGGTRAFPGVACPKC